MSTNITNIIAGPALVRFDGATFYAQGDIVLTARHETFPIRVDALGVVEERVKEESLRVAFIPAGAWEALGVLFPYASALPGSPITGATDKALEIRTFRGRKLTFHNGAVVRMPGIKASATATLLGSVEFECFLKSDTAWGDTAARYSIVDEALTGASFDPASIPTQGYAISWGDASPWDAIETKEGVEVKFDLKLEPIVTDAEGTLSQRIVQVSATATCRPVGIGEDAILEKMLLQGAGAKRGRSLTGSPFEIAGDGVFIRLYGAALTTSPLHFTARDERAGLLTWSATRDFTSGLSAPLFYVGDSAPA